MAIARKEPTVFASMLVTRLFYLNIILHLGAAASSGKYL